MLFKLSTIKQRAHRITLQYNNGINQQKSEKQPYYLQYCCFIKLDFVLEIAHIYCTFDQCLEVIMVTFIPRNNQAILKLNAPKSEPKA